MNDKDFKFALIQDVFEKQVVRPPLPAMRDVPLVAVVRAISARISPSATVIVNGDQIEITTRWFAMWEARAEFYALLEAVAKGVYPVLLFDRNQILLPRGQPVLGEFPLRAVHTTSGGM